MAFSGKVFASDIGSNDYTAAGDSNPESETPNFKPCALNNKPETLNRKACTLNPNPSTLNPKPSTLNL